MDWFKEWFNSPYYHILYKNRDLSEAEKFIDLLCTSLNVKENQKVLDLACGKGRHSLQLHKKKLNVTGTDISRESIKYAKQFQTTNLRFLTRDMRNPMPSSEKYDFVFNLFTSFGYFDTMDENNAVISSIVNSLKPNGKLIIDFMNSSFIIANLVEKETKIIENIEFNLKRYVQQNKIIKEIKILKDHKVIGDFKESVSALFFDDFAKLFIDNNLILENLYGDYNLNKMDFNLSPRMIFVLRKN